MNPLQNDFNSILKELVETNILLKQNNNEFKVLSDLNVKLVGTIVSEMSKKNDCSNTIATLCLVEAINKIGDTVFHDVELLKNAISSAEEKIKEKKAFVENMTKNSEINKNTFEQILNDFDLHETEKKKIIN